MVKSLNGTGLITVLELAMSKKPNKQKVFEKLSPLNIDHNRWFQSRLSLNNQYIDWLISDQGIVAQLLREK